MDRGVLRRLRCIDAHEAVRLHERVPDRPGDACQNERVDIVRCGIHAGGTEEDRCDDESCAIAGEQLPVAVGTDQSGQIVSDLTERRDKQNESGVRSGRANGPCDRHDEQRRRNKQNQTRAGLMIHGDRSGVWSVAALIRHTRFGRKLPNRYRAQSLACCTGLRWCGCVLHPQ